MRTCQNCLKKLSDDFTYCYECGCRLDGEMRGNFRTNFLNVFHLYNEYMYIYSNNGRQVVLKADTIDELKELVELNRFPWMEIEMNEFDFDGEYMEIKS